MADEALEQEEVTVDEPVEAEDSISDIFNDDEVEAQAEEEPEVDEATTEPEKGEPEVEATAEEQVEPPSTEEASQGTVVPVAALVAERLKRQKLEEQIEALKPDETEAPDPIEDPQGYKDYLVGKTESSALKTKIDLSRSVVSSMKEDYQEKEDIFMKLVGEVDEDGKLVKITDPGLQQKFVQSDNPALFIYDHATEYLEIQ